MDISEIFDTLARVNLGCAEYCLKPHTLSPALLPRIDAFIKNPTKVSSVNELLGLIPGDESGLLKLITTYHDQLVVLNKLFDNNPFLIRHQFYTWIALQLKEQSSNDIVNEAIVQSKQNRVRREANNPEFFLEDIFTSRHAFLSVLDRVREKRVPFFAAPMRDHNNEKKKGALSAYFDQFLTNEGLKEVNAAYDKLTVSETIEIHAVRRNLRR